MLLSSVIKSIMQYCWRRKMRLNVVYTTKTMLQISLHFHWPKRDEIKCYNVISSCLFTLLLLFCSLSVWGLHQVALRRRRQVTFSSPSALFRSRQQVNKLISLTQRQGLMAGQSGFVFGRKRRNDTWKNFNYTEVANEMCWGNIWRELHLSYL